MPLEASSNSLDLSDAVFASGIHDGIRWQDISYWRSGRIAQLERVKASASRRADDVALAASASELYRLQSDGAAVLALQQEHIRRDPDGVAALIEWQKP